MHCILTQDPTEWNCERLVAALTKAGKSFFTARVTDFLASEGKTAGVRVQGQNLDACEKIFVRGFPAGSLEQTIFRVDVLHRLENLGVECINPASAIEKCVDKYYTTSLLKDAGLRVPRTVCCENYEDAFSAFAEMGDVVVKPLFGSLGAGIVRITDRDTAYRVLRSIEFSKYVFYLQEFLEHGNEDIRLMVCEEEIIAGMKRRAESWKTNIHQGGRPEKFSPTGEMVEMALKAARILGCRYCGVDMLESRQELYLLEVNGNPGWKGLQKVTPFDIAERLVAMLG